MTQQPAKPMSPDGNTRTQQQETGDRSVPRTPNERDTSADSQSARQSGGESQNQAAAADAASSRQDTSKSTEMDRVYNEQVLDGADKTKSRP